jgi:hypothetical protein
MNNPPSEVYQGAIDVLLGVRNTDLFQCHPLLAFRADHLTRSTVFPTFSDADRKGHTVTIASPSKVHFFS